MTDDEEIWIYIVETAGDCDTFVMSYPHFVAAFSSTVFRLAAFIYLRVIPTSLGPTVLPLFYLAHLLSSPWLVKPRAAQKEKDEPPVAEKQLSLATALFSLPISSTRLRNITVAINSIIFFACLEFTATPYLDTARDLSFTRVGAVYPDSAKIVVRYPAAGNDTKNDVQIFWRQVVADLNETAYPWRDGPLVSLSEEQDWTSTVKLSGLWPSTAYEYALASNRTLLPYPATPISFQTFPDPRLPTGSHFRFVASSCATPNFPYVPFQGRTIKGFDLLANYLSSVKSTAPAEFMLFLGDFIYSDVPFYFGNSKDAYRRLYRRNYQSPSFRKIYERLPVFHIYDDHEIKNDYMGKSNDSNAPFPAASDAYNIYNGAANYDSMSKNQHHYNFQYGDAAFFVLDTRRHRNRELEDPVEHTMLGESQLADLQDWLAKVNSTTTFKFIVSSVPFTSLWSYGQTDTWGGYPKEKAELLNAMHSVPNVVIISGDRHEFAEIAFNGPSHQITEFSTSPLSMFALPFIRTLKRQSEETIDIRNASNEMSTVPRETVKKYLGTGNYKWSSFEVDTRDRARPTLTVEVTIDGHEAYRTEIQGTPVKIQTINAIGALVTTSFKDLFDRIGMQPSRWF